MQFRSLPPLQNGQCFDRCAVQDDSRTVFPVFSEIPKLHAFKGAAFPDEADHVGSPFGRDPIIDHQHLRRSVGIIDDHALDKNGLAHPQLNSAERALAKANLDPIVILSAVNMGVAKVVPDYTPGVKKGIDDQSKERQEGQDNLFLQHLRVPAPSWF